MANRAGMNYKIRPTPAVALGAYEITAFEAAGAYTLFGWVAEGMDVVDKIRPGDMIEHVEVWTGR